MTVAASMPTPTRRHVTWQVDVLERSPGCAAVENLPPHLRVSVGDRDGVVSHGGRRPPPSSVTARLSADGTVLVRSLAAPPALLVSLTGVRLVPAEPGASEPLEMSVDDRLLLCSAAALDALPTGLVAILATPAEGILTMEPAALLEELLEGSTAGGAAVARCVPYADPPGRPATSAAKEQR